ncbi:MAG: N-6 DNA methylase [Planctomycetaceae bacterium]|jgi:type I restriction-modification system DNA methylase subunit|nr:N-6 DNA methylase [Planctomycetaceae bacterium]
MSKEFARQQITKLVEKFSSQAGRFESADYNETQTRRDFIDPFFTALGWDIDNKQELSQSIREVVLEEKVYTHNGTKSVDYAFRIGKTVLFYVEAKKPHVNIKNDQEAAFQLRRYGWSTPEVSVSILTNFKEFAVYDCTKKPDKNDKVHVARLNYLTYQNCTGECSLSDNNRNGFDFLWDTFGHTNVLQGSLEKYVKSGIEKRGIITVDQSFLQLLEDWRTILAKSICRNHKQINEYELNFVVQEILNRIVFLRIAESRGIEHHDNLAKIIESNKDGECYKNLYTLFLRADEKFNSGLFNLDDDKISEMITVDNDVLKTIIKNLYYPSPYSFEKIPIEILGNIYEHFLGKTVRLTAGHHVKIEEKPEVCEAGGVYYTPQYIVDYIVKNTVGQLVEGKNPKDVAKIKIVDPACGSGSFLLGAYQFLLDWHQSYYENNYKSKKIQPRGLKSDTLTPDWKLTAPEKKRILMNNIFGVDIDVIAVEITKLSLLLKCMEGETAGSVDNTLRLFHEKILPDIDSNIRDGNSIIDIDFYDNNFELLIDHQVKPFSWEETYPAVFKQGGFDAVIGNPPWVAFNGKFGNSILRKDAQQYLISKYQGNTYSPNLYEYFVHRGLMLINKTGYFSFIVPDRLGFNKQFVSLRKKIAENFHIEELLYKVPFPGTIADTLIFRFTQKNKKNDNTPFTVGEFNNGSQTKLIKEYINDPDYRFSYEVNNNISSVLHKIFANPKCRPLGSIAETTSGVGAKSSAITKIQQNKNQIAIVRGRSISKYSQITPFFFEFKKENVTGRTVDRKKLGITNKVLLRKTGYPLFATYDESGIYPEQSLYFIFDLRNDHSLKYITALFNSKLFQFIYINRLVTNKNSTPQLKKIDLDQFPVYICEGEDKKLHDSIVKIVDQILQLYDVKNQSLLPQNLRRIKEKINHNENEIDKLINKLYGLTDEEIKTVEGK